MPYLMKFLPFLLCLVVSNILSAQDKQEKEPAKQVDENKVQSTDEEAKKALEEFRKQIEKSKITEDDTISTIGNLGGTKHPKVLDELKKQAKNYKATNKIKIACIEEIAKYTKDKNATGYLSEIYDSNYGKKETKDVSIAALEALGSVASESSVQQLHRIINDKDDDVAVAVVEALGGIKNKASVEPLLRLLKECEAVMDRIEAQANIAAAQSAKSSYGGGKGGNASGKQAAADAYKQQQGLAPTSKASLEQERVKKLQPSVLTSLNSITKQSFSSAKEWESWWAKNRNTFKVE
ncbi:HEAT repeat domain-containing protein [Candidatus Peregrinibacteria bacterium]|nr:HEAT repeat domain-containing protein [Candidatus Peregrinibacteria bacterium]